MVPKTFKTIRKKEKTAIRSYFFVLFSKHIIQVSEATDPY